MIEAKEYLPEFYSDAAGYDDIEVRSGNYPIQRDQDENLTYTIVNINLID